MGIESLAIKLIAAAGAIFFIVYSYLTLVVLWRFAALKVVPLVATITYVLAAMFLFVNLLLAFAQL